MTHLAPIKGPIANNSQPDGWDLQEKAHNEMYIYTELTTAFQRKFQWVTCTCVMIPPLRGRKSSVLLERP